MLAARDQENLVHGRQVAASCKPLNQGLANAAPPPPKTPAAKPFKTPYKAPQHDENAPMMTGLGGRKMLIAGGGGGFTKGNNNNNENLKTAGKKNGGGLDKNAFVTPFGPRNRAPLGVKTTNAKAKAFQTPAIPVVAKERDHSQYHATTTARKPKQSKVTTHATAETTKAEQRLSEVEDESDEREIEYMPPKPKDLPDFPPDFPPNLSYAPLRGPNLTRGWYQTYAHPLDPDGRSHFDRHLDALQRQADDAFDALVLKAVDDMPLRVGPRGGLHAASGAAAGDDDDDDFVLRDFLSDGLGPNDDDDDHDGQDDDVYCEI